MFVVNFTPTGMTPMKESVPSVPVSAIEIIEQVHEAYELGITMTHLHARDEAGNPTSEVKYFSPILEGVRKHCEDLVICASLSGRNVTDPVERSEVLSLKPDMASLTLSSLNFPQQAAVNSPSTIELLAQRISQYGAKAELEVFDLGMANYLHYLIRKGLIEAPFYVNVILGNIAGAQVDFADVAALLARMPGESMVALGGVGRFQLDAHVMALSAGLGVRVGLEDNVFFDRPRRQVTSNIELLKRIHQLAGLTERTIMSPAEFGAKGFYNRFRD
jgi:3-keto-5-aminohexanoate cleavage enzyme